ncbi:MAG: hypothetical protein MPN21_21175 [Thermoanaerobaculia bacterium]|nr:hypothetical protein [Thermoanaerobaculia bacterium]
MTRFALIILVFLVSSLGSQPAEASHDEGIVVRYAVLLGTGHDDSTPPENAHLTVDGLMEWDFQRDNDELMKLLGLRKIHTLQHSSVHLDRDKGEIGTSTLVGESTIDVRMSIEVFRDQSPDGGPPSPYSTTWFEIKRAGEILSTPKVTSLLGQRAIVSTSAEDKSWILFLVVEVHDVEPSESKSD